SDRLSGPVFRSPRRRFAIGCVAPTAALAGLGRRRLGPERSGAMMKASWIGPLTRIAMLLGVCALAPAAQAQLPTIHIWPSDVPPCHTTLQACVDGAASGDQIRIATNGPISEEIDFSKSL